MKRCEWDSFMNLSLALHCWSGQIWFWASLKIASISCECRAQSPYKQHQSVLLQPWKSNFKNIFSKQTIQNNHFVCTNQLLYEDMFSIASNYILLFLYWIVDLVKATLATVLESNNQFQSTRKLWGPHAEKWHLAGQHARK